MPQFEGVGEEVHHIAQAALVEFWAGKILGQNATQAVVFALNLHHRIVDDLTNLGCVGSGRNDAPAGIGWHVEDILRGVFVLVLLESVALVHKLLMLDVELVADVLQENEPQHHVLILRSINGATQQVGRLPYLILKAYVGCILFLCHI